MSVNDWGRFPRRVQSRRGTAGYSGPGCFRPFRRRGLMSRCGLRLHVALIKSDVWNPRIRLLEKADAT